MTDRSTVTRLDDFVQEDHDEVIHLNEINLKANVMLGNIKHVAPYTQNRMREHIMAIMELESLRMGELESNAYTAKNTKRLFGALGR